MRARVSKKERKEFIAYLQACTDDQVVGVYHKEKIACRRAHTDMAKAEMFKRNLSTQERERYR